MSPITTEADTLQLADETGATEAPSTVRTIRSFVRGRRRRSWLDLYAIGFAIVIGCIYASDLLTAPFSRLNGAAAYAAGHASSQAASQAVAGTALVIAIAAGLLMLAQAFGPIALSPADSFWRAACLRWRWQGRICTTDRARSRPPGWPCRP